MKKKFKARGYLNDAAAEEIGIFIEETFGDKPYTPEDLVKAATPKRSKIHKYFEWDDTIAAHKWRIQQARIFVNCIVVMDDDGQETNYYESVIVEDTRSYMNLDKIRASECLIDQIIDKALDELDFWKQKYEKYEEFKLIVKEIENAKEKRSKNKENSGKRGKNTKTRHKRSKNNFKRHKSTTSQQI